MPTRTPREAPAKRPRKTSGEPARTSRAEGTGPDGRVHLYVGISLDGHIAAPDGGVDWLNPCADAQAGFAPFIKTIGSAVMGRATYDYAVARGFLDYGGMTSYVVTHRPFEPPSPSVIPFTGPLPDLVARLRRDHPGDIWLMGGGQVTKSFLEDDLIDILSVAFVPTLLGDGLPLFPHGSFRERRIRLVRTHTYPSGVVELRYERAAG
ncbi:MAG: dihydrofolate reductase [Acidobacteria bacterium]|nr:MAG: dihydrofolate reductase [Acidobacteriota bacterium]